MEMGFLAKNGQNGPAAELYGGLPILHVAWFALDAFKQQNGGKGPRPGNRSGPEAPLADHCDPTAALPPHPAPPVRAGASWVPPGAGVGPPPPGAG